MSKQPPSFPHRLPPLSPELQRLLDAELAAGNTIAEIGPSPSRPDEALVLLASPFRARPAELPSGVDYRETNDPHWWKAEYFHRPTQQCLACRF